MALSCCHAQSFVSVEKPMMARSALISTAVRRPYDAGASTRTEPVPPEGISATRMVGGPEGSGPVRPTNAMAELVPAGRLPMSL